MDKLHLKKSSEEADSPFISSVLLPLLRYKKLTYTIVAVTLTVTLIYCLLISNWYTSTATILPSGGSGGLSSLTSLAAGNLADLGLGSIMQAEENSSALYPKILTSRLISEKILNKQYDFSNDGEQYSMTMYEYIHADNIDKAIEKLRKLVTIDVDSRTGVIKLSVMTEYPEFSAEVVHAYLDQLNDYNVNHRKSKARANKTFIAGRLDEVKEELNTAENDLKVFQNQNRNYASSNDPSLLQELDRLQRQVTIKETVMMELTKQFELARVEAAKDIPIVQVIDRGSVPIVKTKPRRTLYMLGALFGSLFISFVLSLWIEIARRRKLAVMFNNVLASPEFEMNRIESKLLNTASKTVNRLKETFEKTDRMSVTK